MCDCRAGHAEADALSKDEMIRNLCRSAEVWMVRAPNLPVILDVRGAACVVFVCALKVPEIFSKLVVHVWVVEPI